MSADDVKLVLEALVVLGCIVMGTRAGGVGVGLWGGLGTGILVFVFGEAPGEPPAEESFEATPAFAWLQAKAPAHGFHMSYPRDNPHGIIYEPWHWCYAPPAAAAFIPASA